MIYIQVILGLRVDHTMRVFVLYWKENRPPGSFNLQQNMEKYSMQMYFATEFTEKHIALSKEIELLFVTLSYL